MKSLPIAVVFVVVCAWVAHYGIGEARRGWWDPDWRPGTRSGKPQGVAARAITVVSFVVLASALTAHEAFAHVRTLSGACLFVAGCGFILMCLGIACMATISWFGRPAFLVPPRLRRNNSLSPRTGVGQLVGAATVDGALAASAPMAGGPYGRRAPEDLLADDEFSLVTGRGVRRTGGIKDAGRLQLTSRRIMFRTVRDHLDLPGYSWQAADIRSVAPGRSRRELDLGLADGSEERFDVTHRRLWISKIESVSRNASPVAAVFGEPAEPSPVPAGAAVLVLSRRPGQLRDFLRSYRVIVDEQQVASIRQGGRTEVPLSPGYHFIHLAISRYTSPVIPVDAEAGQVIRLYCEPGGSLGTAAADPLRHPGTYIRLLRQ